MKTYVVGRSPYADVVIPDPSISERHAEIVETDDRRWFITDCGTQGGTSRLNRGPGGRSWAAIRQCFVAPDDVLRLGEHECELSDLLGQVERPEGSFVAGSGERAVRTAGRVERDPLTGEIVRRTP